MGARLPATMTLSPGERLGPYEILQPIGAGGMGEVYRARDTRLNRAVAVKVLPAMLTNNPACRQRLEREARAASNLNHPHICVLHDIGEDRGIVYLVMEHLEGETLAQRLERGPLPLAETLRYTIEVAGAIHGAHRSGIVHRDLKPGNIMLTKNGAKLLDFGLAKSILPAAAAETQSAALTCEGMMVGTIRYMSPEQLEGKDADARSDIFALGATLYEMIAGRSAFQGKSAASLIAAILTSDPPPASSAQATSGDGRSAALDWIVRRCLAKEPADRIQSARDLEQDLLWIQTGGLPVAAAAVVPLKSRTRLAWAAAALFVLASSVLAALLIPQQKPAPKPIRLTVNAPEGTMIEPANCPRVSPDGETIVFAARNAAGLQLYLHSLRSGTSRPLTGTEGCRNAYWSPDGRSLFVLCGATTSGANQFRVDVAGGTPQPLRLPFLSTYTAWGPNGIITTSGSKLYWLRADGTGIRPFNSLPNLSYPTWVPGTDWLVYNELTRVGEPQVANQVHLATSNGKIDRKAIITDTPAIFVHPGYLLYRRGSLLMAQPFNAKSGRVVGDAVAVLDGVGAPEGNTSVFFSASNNGVLAFSSGVAGEKRQLTWYNRAGKRLTTVGDPAGYSSPALSPDGKLLAVTIRDAATKPRALWVFDLTRSTASRLTSDLSDDAEPVWSPDGASITFQSTRRGHDDLFLKSSAGIGEEELLLDSPNNKRPESWSPDGRFIAFFDLPPAGVPQLWLLPLDSRKPQQFSRSTFAQLMAQFSPNGKWLAYTSNQSGRSEVYVQSVAEAKGRYLISNAGGFEPQWRADGKELFYSELSTPARIMAVDLDEKNGVLKPGIPHGLFEVALGPAGAGQPTHRWVVSRDGQKFLAVTPLEQKTPNVFHVVLNWPLLLIKE